MNASDAAYYVCNAGKNAFVMSYDGPSPQQATLNTSGQKAFTLKKTPVASGVMFAGGGVKFWTDGARVSVTGTPVPLQACALH